MSYKRSESKNIIQDIKKNLKSKTQKEEKEIRNISDETK
jgi:hypothetical protein